MARSKPSAQGELLTHRDEIHNHKHCIKYHKFDKNSLTMPPIGEEINYYKWWLWLWWWWRWRWRLDLKTMAAVDGFFIFVSRFWSRGGTLYRGSLHESCSVWPGGVGGIYTMWTIRPGIPPHSCSSCSVESSLEPRLLWVVWNLVSLTLMLWFPFPHAFTCAGKDTWEWKSQH